MKELFRQGDYVGAYKYCKENSSPLTNVLRVGVGLLGDGKQVAEEGMLAELAKENSTMQTYISYLSVIGVCAPMIGLLGTVLDLVAEQDLPGFLEYGFGLVVPAHVEPAAGQREQSPEGRGPTRTSAAQDGQMAGTISSPGSSGSLGQSPGSSSGTVP